MKKILLSLVCAVTGMVTFAQDFTITGTILDQNGNPSVNHAVFISSDSTVFYYSNTVYTDASGNYQDIVINGAQVGPNVDYFIYINDYCTPNGGWQSATLSNNQGTVTSGVADFTVCDSTVGCYASFYGYDQTNTGNYYFYNMSSGSGLTYAWDFGDGNTSNAAFPTHTYTVNGTYTVCLTVSNTTCSDTYCSSITVGGQSCNAGFYSYIDTTNSTVYLVDLSNGGATSYYWDFGDGNTSTLQYPVHTYANPGFYLVCLTITDGMMCTSTHCDSIGYVPFMSEESRSGFTVNVIPAATNSVEEQASVSALNLFPNPANENVTLNYTSLNSGSHQISITDISGKLISTENYSAQKGINQKQISLTEMNAGIYMVTITDENGNASHLRLIKE